MSASPPPSQESLVGIEKAAERTADFLVAGISIFLYDWILTFSDELQDIWLSSFSAVKMLFLVNRYVTPSILVLLCLVTMGDKTQGLANACGPFTKFVLHVIQISIFRCPTISAVTGIGMTCIFCVWNAIIAIRLHALYGLHEKVKYFLICLVFTTTCATLGLSISQMVDISRNVVSFLDLGICVPGELPKDYFTIWIPGIFYETVIFTMSLSKLRHVRGSRTKASLYSLLLRDGTLHYVVLTGLRITNLVMFIQADPARIYTSLFLTMGLGSTLVSRMILNLRNWGRLHFDDSPYIIHGADRAQHTVTTRAGHVHGVFELATRGTGSRSYGLSTLDGALDEGDERDISVHLDVGGQKATQWRRKSNPLPSKRPGVVSETEVIVQYGETVHRYDDAVAEDVGLRDGDRKRRDDIENFDPDLILSVGSDMERTQERIATLSPADFGMGDR